MKRTDNLEFIRPDWPAPGNVYACTTTREIGNSDGDRDGFSLGSVPGVEWKIVLHNRRLLGQTLNLSAEPRWLKQEHGNKVVMVGQDSSRMPSGDASVSFKPGQACAVLTADCSPVVLCAQTGTSVAVAHAGWRGLAAGILEATVQALGVLPGGVLAWIGPTIGPRAYEVGDDVRSVFVDANEDDALAFLPNNTGAWLANLPLLVRNRLIRVGVNSIYGGDRCTHTDAERFFSHRRDGQCGRMATVAWFV